MSDEYSSVASGKLKLKSDGCSEAKKKSKKKKRDKEKLKASAEQAIRNEKGGQDGGRTDGQAMQGTSAPVRTLTKAEVAFKKQQEKTQKKRILEKASQTHKQRVEKFNQHLDSLTEHYDIPKVSWTK